MDNFCFISCPELNRNPGGETESKSSKSLTLNINPESNKVSGRETESKNSKSQAESYVTAYYSSQQLRTRSSSCIAAQSTDGEAYGFVDSCSTHVLTRVEEDMTGFDTETPNARVSGVGGLVSELPVGWTGTLKSNELELRQAIYYSELPVDRVMSTGDLYKAGWRTVLDGPDSRLESRNTGEIRKVFQGEGSLPLASVGFRKGRENDTQTLLTEAKAESKLQLERQRCRHTQGRDQKLTQRKETLRHPRRKSAWPSPVNAWRSKTRVKSLR